MKIFLILLVAVFLAGCAVEQESVILDTSDLPDSEPLPISEDFDDSDQRADERDDPSIVDRFFRKSVSCEGVQFTVPMVDLDEIREITPLGNLNPPEHTLPTEHTYVHLESTGVELRAPADIRVTSISYTGYVQEDRRDYAIDYELCDDVVGYFLHIKTITPELEELLEDCEKHVYGDGKYENCWARADLNLKAGDKIGTVGNDRQGNFDVGAADFRITLDYANPSRYEHRSPSIVCAYDYYDDENKEAFYSKLDRNLTPLCGEVNQDIPGTLQGNWYYGGGKEWNEHLTFGHNVHDPRISEISVGGIFMEASKWEFTAVNSGNTNREFSKVKDGDIICYEAKNRGKLVVELGNDEIQIEHQDGSCSNSESLRNPTIYKR